MSNGGGAREWRLYLVAALAGIYLLAWNLIAPGPEPGPVLPTHTVWLDELPAAIRPTVTPPPGWRVAERVELVAPPLRRVSASQPARVRTRSS